MTSQCKIKKLGLTKEDLDQISSQARNLRFKIKSIDEFLYSNSSESIIENFLKGIDFLFYLKNNIQEEGISKKIDIYLEQFNDLNQSCLDFKNKKNNLFKYIYKNKCDKLLKENYEMIKLLIIEVFPIGKVVEVYNVNDSIGY